MKRFIFLGLMLALPAFAGNGSSGGGNIFGDQLNPWFLQNTKTVNYCVEIDPSFSTLGRERILQLIDKSFGYWKKAFASASGLHSYMNFNPKLATQKFILSEECHAGIDVKFQLGFLTPDQKKTLPGYKQLLGLAYRTSYDEVNLKGKGFIYIAPESGPARPLSPNLHSNPWSYGKQRGLELVLTHELGHIFGLQDHHYTYFSLMGAKFPDTMTSKGSVEHLNSEKREFPSPLGCNAKFEGDHQVFYMSAEIPPTEIEIEKNKMTDPLRTELGLPSKFAARFTTRNNKMVIRINKKVFGEIDLVPFGNTSGGESEPAVSLYLTKKQKVFKKLPENHFNTHSVIYDVTINTTKKNEELKLSNGKSYKVFVQYSNHCYPTIGMIHNDQLYFDIFSGL